MMNTIIVWIALIYGTAWLGDGVNSFPQKINFKLNSTVHTRYKFQSNTITLLFFKIHLRQHVSALESHHQVF